MTTPLSVLFIDDSDDDVQLLMRHLVRAGYELTSARVETPADLARALQERSWDIALCDYSMPEMTALEVLASVRGSGTDLPIIAVSGAVGEDTAAECMRSGMHDFVLKDRLSRLVPAIEREREDAQQRVEKRKVEAQLLASEEALARSEKLGALGKMAAGVSHDLKNILHPLSLHLQLVERSMNKGQLEVATSSIAEMRQVLARGLQTIERLRDYSRQAPESRAESIDLDKLVREAVEISRPRMNGKTGTTYRVAEELGHPPKIAGRSGEIVSALVNILVNAVEAMPKGGTIWVGTGESEGGAWVEIADDGPGMSPEVERRVFEPFFTTKGSEGTGLGLAMVYATVQRHGGRVALTTAPGRGTSFRLWFAMAAGAHVEVPAEQRAG